MSFNSSAFYVDAATREFLQRPLHLAPERLVRVRALRSDFYIAPGRVAVIGEIAEMREFDARTAAGCGRVELV